MPCLAAYSSSYTCFYYLLTLMLRFDSAGACLRNTVREKVFPSRGPAYSWFSLSLLFIQSGLSHPWLLGSFCKQTSRRHPTTPPGETSRIN